MDNTPYAEKRRSQRYEIGIDVFNTEEYTGRQINGFTTDISSIGLGLVVNSDILLDMPLDIKIVVPDSKQQVCVKGRAVWSHRVAPGQYRVGVKLDTRSAAFNPIPIILRTIHSRVKTYA